MRFRKTRKTSRVAAMFTAAAAVVLVPGIAGAAYSWSTSPADGDQMPNDGNVQIAAVVKWGATDRPLFNGTVAAAVSGYTGQTTYTYSYSGQNQQPGQGTFAGNGLFPKGSINFNPALNPGTSVAITFTASTTTGLPPTTTQSSTTVTATAP